jgi:hypothetical protein
VFAGERLYSRRARSAGSMTDPRKKWGWPGLEAPSPRRRWWPTSTKPDRSKCSTKRLATIADISSSALWARPVAVEDRRVVLVRPIKTHQQYEPACGGRAASSTPCPRPVPHSRRRQAMTAIWVRREKAALSSGCKSHPANAPAGSNRSSHGGDEMAEAFGVAGHV